MYLPEEAADGGELPLHIRRELQVLRGLQHPGIVSLLDVRQQVREGWAGIVGRRRLVVQQAALN